jgi:hypothetical protein
MEIPPPEVGPSIGPPHFDFTSGGRLRARVITGDGAEPLLQAIFDSERRQDCQFLPASDGQLRCLPVVPEPFQNTGRFSDPECRFAIYAPRATCSGAARFASVYRSRTGCSDRAGYEVYQLAPTRPGPSYHRGLRGCVPATAPAGGLTPTTPAPVADWVAGTEQLRPDTGRLRARQVQSDDGGRFTLALVDTTYGWDCHTAIDQTLAGRCVQPRTGTGLFADAGCTEPAFLSGDPCPRAPVIDGTEQVRGVGSRVEGEVFAGESGGRCQPFELKLPGTYFRYGEVLGPLTFPAVRLTRTGTGRLLRDTVEHEGQLLSRPYPAYFDQTLGGSCTPQRTDQGLRCVSVAPLHSGGVEPAFADAACTRPLHACHDCEGEAMGIFSSDSCGGPEHVTLHRVGPRHPGQVYHLVDGACTGPVDPRGPKLEPLVLNSIGEELSVERFAPLVERTE